MIRAKASCASLLICLLAAAAPAQEHPPYLPPRDVAMNYQRTQTGKSGSRVVRAYYSVRNRKLGVEILNARTYVIMLLDEGKIQTVTPQSRSYLKMPFGFNGVTNMLPNQQMQFAKRGIDQVAGLARTVWDMQGTQIRGQACITGDGVILYGAGEEDTRGGGAIRARMVQYGAQPDSLFTPPKGYKIIEGRQAPSGATGSILGAGPDAPR